MSILKKLMKVLGGAGSGNFGHGGRAGERGGSSSEETTGDAAKWVYQYSWDASHDPNNIPKAVEKELNKYKPEGPVTLYRFERPDHDPEKASGKTVQSWSHNKQMVESIAEMTDGVVREKTFQPDEVFTDFTKFPPKLQQEIEKRGGDSSMQEVLVYLKTPDVKEVAPSSLKIEVHSKDVVNQYVERIQAGEKLTPVFVSKTDSSRVVDGNHRAAAYKKLKMDVPVFKVDRLEALNKMGEGLSPEEYYAMKTNTLQINPFKSEAQRKWMWATDPEMAKEWEKETPDDKDLPKKTKTIRVNGLAEGVVPMATVVLRVVRPEVKVNGGAGSGNFGHAGVPGQVGGSASDGEVTTGTFKWDKQEEIVSKLHGYVEEYNKEGRPKDAEAAKEAASLVEKGMYDEAIAVMAKAEIHYDIKNTYLEITKARRDKEIHEKYGSDWGTKPGTYTAYRSGPITGTSRGVFFAVDPGGARAYSKEDGKDFHKYEVTVKNPYTIARVENAYADLTGTPIEKVLRDKAGKDAAKWWVRIDQQVAKLAREKGHDALVYTDPAPPAMREIVLFDKKAISLADEEPKTNLLQRLLKTLGSGSSGNFGHGGRPGQRGGSAPKGESGGSTKEEPKAEPAPHTQIEKVREAWTKTSDAGMMKKYLGHVVEQAAVKGKDILERNEKAKNAQAEIYDSRERMKDRDDAEAIRMAKIWMERVHTSVEETLKEMSEQLGKEITSVEQLDSEHQAAMAKVAVWNSKTEEVNAAYRETLAALTTFRSETNKQIRDAITIGTATSVPPNSKVWPSDSKMKVKGDFKDAAVFLENIIDPKKMVDAPEIQRGKDGDSRSHYYPTGKYVGDSDPVIEIAYGSDGSTFVHEFGHHLEHTVSGAMDASFELFNRRTKDVEPETDKKYGKDVVIKRAFPVDDYAGRVYKHRATELISVGLEHLYRNPSRFRAVDPEHFDLIIDTLAKVKRTM